MKRKSWKFWLYRIVRLFFVAYGTVALFACSVGDRLLFAPPPVGYALSEEEVVQFGNDDEYAGLYLSAQVEAAPTLLWAHGNAEDAGMIRPVIWGLQERGFNVFAYDYPGYGLSKGKPNEKGTYQAAEKAFRFLVEEKGKNPKEVFLVGQSVGSGPSTYLAERGEAGGLILISPFKSAFRVVTKVKVLPWDRFDNFKRMKNVEIPLLVLHGDADEVVPFSHGEALFERHQGEKELVRLEGVGHNDLWAQSRDEVFAAIVEFADQADQ